MALRQRGKLNYWHAYYVAWERTPDGGLRRKHVEVNLGTTDRDVAKSLEIRLMRKAREQSIEARASAKIEAILNGTTVSVVHAEPRKRRLKVSDALLRAARYRELGDTAKKLWRRFERSYGDYYLDEVTPQHALVYLESIAPNGGKVYNNSRSALNGIFKLLLIDAGLQSSPFELIRPSRCSTLSQRPITSEEYRRILKVAPSPWKEAVQIAWWTGMREKDVFTLKWSEIRGDLIRKLPAKTARFRREVLIPVHPVLASVLKALRKKKSKDGRVLGAWSYNPNYIGFRRAFGDILRKAGVQSGKDGRVCFNSLRNSFISRCDAAGIPRHAIRGIVGHVSDDMTDLYSHDETSARMIQNLPENDSLNN